MSGKTGALSWRDRWGLFAGRGAAWASRIAGRGSGGMIGGKVALKISPNLLEHLATGKKIALVTGTNGKTTTTRMLSEAMTALGRPVASNRGGDNMTAGVLSALMQSPDAPVAVLEVDEMHLEAIANATHPAVIVLLNLSRDQLDRVGEISVIERRIRAAVDENPQATVVANVDDPLVTSAAWDAARPLWVAAGKGWSGDSLTSPRTQGAIIYGGKTASTSGPETVTSDTNVLTGQKVWASGQDTDAYWQSVPVDELLALDVPWERPPSQVEFARPEPAWIWQASSFQEGEPMRAVETANGREHEIVVNLPGRANRGNALQAFVAALALGADPEPAARSIREVRNVAGRYAHLEVKGRKIRMLLAKNPAGWMESLTMLNPEAQLVVGVNGQRADGTDLSWLWDVNFEALRGKTVVATGERGADLQVRLNYAGIITLWAPEVESALEQVPSGEVDMLLNYTAFRDARAEFIAKGWLQ
ncbi:MAG: MurT ligase domain-containing protein [Mobiluncus porci]|uniref:MurT ligase domain-containing protein n=1 Tax=Mobiluncus porci TaxID=2652278 RepID=UPI0023EF9E6B|nr:MurT ligase domain-containing protein [Mobiluncus porci]MDD7541350.1 MurT ligase domain-containing protein [Mobiluncus porci]MDY5747833.1 MurT ligase domain-containing protein [Mobiluncus porci]